LETTIRQLKCVNNGGFPHLLTEGKIYKLIREETYGYTLVHDKSPIEGTFPKNLFEPAGEEVDAKVSNTDVILEAIQKADQKVTTARETQVGGSHYTKLAIQPYEFCHANRMGYIEGTALKYLSRWRGKGGIEDLRKAKHAIEWLIEYEEREGEKGNG